MKGESLNKKWSDHVDAGLHLRSFELESIKEGLRAQLYVDKRGMISCLIRADNRKIKSPLKLPAKEATFLRLLIDAQIIPLKASMVKMKRGWRVRIKIG
jgi:hypothetical protein